MCNIGGIIFGASNLTRQEIEGKRIIEIGAHDVNGSLRDFIESRSPAEYIGIDIEAGPGVDLICNVEELVDRFGKESFDIVISTELLEHTREWRKAVSNIKNICKHEAIVIITTRSIGFKYHGYPYDFWRYEIEDIRNIFSDFVIVELEKDRSSPGVFLKARRPVTFIENDLSGYELFSIITNKRIKEINNKLFVNFQRKYKHYLRKQKIRNIIKRYILSL